MTRSNKLSSYCRSWEEAITARVLTNDISVRGMKLKCAYFLKQVGGY
jgi:hypothetical protein